MPEKKNRNQLLLEKYIKEEKEGKNFRLNNDTVSRYVNKYRIENSTCFEEMRSDWKTCCHVLSEIYSVGYKVASNKILKNGLSPADIKDNLESLAIISRTNEKLSYINISVSASRVYTYSKCYNKRINPYYIDIIHRCNYRAELKKNKMLTFDYLFNGLKRSFELGYLSALKEYIDKYIKLLEEYPFVLEYLQDHKRTDKSFKILYPVTSGYMEFLPK